MTIESQFRDFLIRNRAKQKFEDNFRAAGRTRMFDKDGRFRWGHLTDYIIGCFGISEFNPTMLIGENCGYITFSWITSPEGLDYWCKLAVTWRNEISILKK